MPSLQAANLQIPASRRYLACALAVNYAAMICIAIAISFIPVILTTLRRDMGALTNEQLGRIESATFVGAVIGILFTGPLADRRGTKFFAAAGSALVGLGLAILGTRPGYDLLIFGVFVMGVGAGMLDMLLSPIVAALQPVNRSSALNWLHSFFCIGAVLTALFTTLALDAGIHWQNISLALIPVPGLVMLLFLFIRMPPPVPGDRTPIRLRNLARRRYFQITLLAIFFAGATEGGLTQWLPAYAETTLRFSKTISGMSLAAFSIAMALGRMIAGTIGHRLSGTSLILLGCIGSIAMLIVGSVAPISIIALAACIGTGLTCSVLWPTTLAISADKIPNGGATFFGVLAAFGSAGGIFMPWGVGAVSNHGSLRVGISLVAFCPFLMALCLLQLRRKAFDGTVD